MASDIFAKLGDIKGESNDAKHKDEIEVLSWSWGVTQTGSMAHGGGGGEGKATFHDLHFMHHIDKASPVLMQGVRDRRAHQGSDDHGAQGRQGPAGIPDHQDERHHRHGRAAGGSGDGAATAENVACSSRRSTSNTSRRSRTARSTPASTSSTTSRPTRKANTNGRWTRCHRGMDGTWHAQHRESSQKATNVTRLRGGSGDMFLTVKGAKPGVIKGESQDDQHKDEIDVMSWSWGMQAKSTIGGGTATGKATVHELRIVKRVDSASTALMAALAHERADPEGRAHAAQGGQDAARVPQDHDRAGPRRLAHHRAGETGGSPELFEHVSFSFNKITVEYTPQGTDGQPQGGMTFRSVERLRASDLHRERMSAADAAERSLKDGDPLAALARLQEQRPRRAG